MSSDQDTPSSGTEAGAFKRFVVRELQDGVKSVHALTTKFNLEANTDAVLAGTDETLTVDTARRLLDELTKDELISESDADGELFETRDWSDRPLRVVHVSAHTIKLDGVTSMQKLWVTESLRSTRQAHGYGTDELQSITGADDRESLVISLRDYATLEDYREQLTVIAETLWESNEAKAEMYHRLSDAIELQSQHDIKQREIPLQDD